MELADRLRQKSAQSTPPPCSTLSDYCRTLRSWPLRPDGRSSVWWRWACLGYQFPVPSTGIALVNGLLPGRTP
jgi:hypothetical protein